MPTRRPALPPRPITPGDIVATFCQELGEWSAAQIVALDPRDRQADVVDLNWSGPEPYDVADLGDFAPLRLTHHGYNALAQAHREWVLPRSYKNLGNASLCSTEESRTWTLGWRVGLHLHWQRRWDAGERGDFDPLDQSGEHEYNDEDGRPLPTGKSTFPQAHTLRMFTTRTVDAAIIAAAFPNLRRLGLSSEMGRLDNASELNRLQALRHFDVHEMFGMTADDTLDPQRLSQLEYISLDSVPADYARGMQRAWAPEASKGVFLSISKPRTPAWVRENVENPLRAWDGREGISNRAYKQALAAWKTSTRPILDALIAAMDDAERRDRLIAHGQAFAAAFDVVDGPSHILETEERDELLEALDQLITHATAHGTVDSQEASRVVLDAVNKRRNW